MKYVSAKRMQEIDKITITKYNIPDIILMENAGIKVTDEVLKSLNKMSGKKIVLFCGKGNNAGDGFVIARQLKSKGFEVVVYLLCAKAEIKKQSALINFKTLRPLGIKVIEVKDVKYVKKIKKRFSADIIIDAIFGTGFSGTLPVYIGYLVNFLNSLNTEIISVDIPSGLDATTGKVYDCCVKASKTVTFGLAKTGFQKNQGPAYVGELVVRNIGFPQNLLK